MAVARVRAAVRRDHSLDDFSGTAGGGTDDASDDSDDDAAVESDDPDGDAAVDETSDAEPVELVEPAEPTRSWSPDGAACAACGGTTETRWRRDGTYVCPDCKEW